MTPTISIVYVTGRRVPKWEWFVESLCSQTTPEQRDNFELIFVDSQLWAKGVSWPITDYGDTPDGISFDGIFYHDATRLAELYVLVNGRFKYRHIPPLPSAWQGAFRQTSKDWFCAGNSRNTAAVVASNPYLVFVDDLSVLMPGWFDQVLHADQDGYVVCGAYKKVKKLKVSPVGAVESFEEYPGGVDSRWSHGSDSGIVPWHGSGLFGCSFGVPLEAMLEVDGNDRACDAAGAEDYDLGIRLERAGYAFFYNRNMLTLESEEDHGGTKLPQDRKIVTPDRFPAGYESYQMVNEAEKYWSDHVMLNRVRNENTRILPTIGSNLRAMRERFLATGLVALPEPDQKDWRDGTPLTAY